MMALLKYILIDSKTFHKMQENNRNFLISNEKPIPLIRNIKSCSLLNQKVSCNKLKPQKITVI